MKNMISSLLIGAMMLSLSCALIGCESTPQKLPDEKVNPVEDDQQPTQAPDSGSEDKEVAPTITHDEVVMQSIDLSNALETNTEYTEYYGGLYIDNVKIIVLLTEMNEEFIAFCKNYVGENASYELCEVSLAELDAIYETILDYKINYVKSDNNKLNELVNSIVSGGTDVMENRVYISIIDCTDEKIALFKKHIVDSEYILFENTDDYVELQ